MKREATGASHEVETFEEYTLYSLERSTPALLRMMERSKQVAGRWPDVAAMIEAAGLCQEVAAMASFQHTLGNVLGLEKMTDAMGGAWKKMSDALGQMMKSLDDALSVKEPGAIKQLFAVELPGVLNQFVEVIPQVERHVKETYMADPGEVAPAGAGSGR